MVVSRRVHAAEQNGETGRTVSEWGDTPSHRRTLRHRDVEGDEGWVSHGREEDEETGNTVCSGRATCVPHQLHMYYKWSLWFNHQTVSHIEENGKLEQRACLVFTI